MSKLSMSGRVYARRVNVFSRRFASFPDDWYIFVVNDFWPTYNVHRLVIFFKVDSHWQWTGRMRRMSTLYLASPSLPFPVTTTPITLSPLGFRVPQRNFEKYSVTRILRWKVPTNLWINKGSSPLRSLKISEKSVRCNSRKLNFKISKNKIGALLSAVVLTIEVRSLHS